MALTEPPGATELPPLLTVKPAGEVMPDRFSVLLPLLDMVNHAATDCPTFTFPKAKFPDRLITRVAPDAFAALNNRAQARSPIWNRMIFAMFLTRKERE
jgi:hypothetical protein